MPLYEMTPDAFRPNSQVVVQEGAMSELYIDRGSAEVNKRIFDHLHEHQSEVEKAFGGPLSWERLDTKRACRIRYVVEAGGYRSPESQWPAIQSAMVDAMIRLEAALKPSLASLSL